MEFIKTLDIYSSNINFYFNGQEKVRTISGGILSLVTLIITFFITFIFGKDFYYRINPKTTSEIVFPSNFPVANLSEFQIIWRLEDYSTNTINFTDILYPNVKYFRLKKNITTDSYDIIENIELNYTTCDKIQIQDQSDLSFKPAQSNCIVLDKYSDKLLGGDLSEDSFSSILVDISSCSKVTNKCSNSTQLIDFFKDFVYLKIMAQKILFSTDDLVKPLKIKPIVSYSLISPNLYLENSIHFSKHILNDDQGWIFSNPENKTKITFDKIVSNSKFRDTKEYDNNQPLSLVSNFFYLKKDYIYTRRTFMKLQELASISGGFISSLRLLIGIINIYFFEFERNLSFLKELFIYKKSENINQIYKNGKFKFKSGGKNLNFNISKIEKDKIFIDLNHPRINKEDSSRIGMNEESPDGKRSNNIELNNIIDNNYKQDVKEIESRNFSDKGNNLKNKNQNISVSNDSKKEYSFEEKIYRMDFYKNRNDFSDLKILNKLKNSIFFCIKKNKKEIFLNQAYNNSIKKITNKIDIIYIIKSFNYLKILKDLFINKNEQFLIKNYFKHSFNTKDEKIKIDGIQKIEMIEYFQNFTEKENKKNFVDETSIDNTILKQFNGIFNSFEKI